MILLRVLSFIVGAGITALAVSSAVKTFVLPRSASDPLTRLVFRIVRFFFELRMAGARSYLENDRILAYYAPYALLALLPTWLSLVTLGYTGMYWASGAPSWYRAFVISGSSLLTLGYAPGENFLQTLLVFTEAALGMLLVALLIAYLPSMYAAFSHREAAVTLLEVRAGNPPSAVEMITRFSRIHGLEHLSEIWQAWETWFAEIEESHTSLAALVFFRSPEPSHSWVTAAGAVLDGAALMLSAVDAPYEPAAALCIRAGYLALRRIAAFFKITYHPDPHFPDQTISITRQEFDAALDLMAASGVPLKTDRELAWRDFAGWRVNYDHVLLVLASITRAPYALWTGLENPQEFRRRGLKLR